MSCVFFLYVFEKCPGEKSNALTNYDFQVQKALHQQSLQQPAQVILKY